MTAEPRCLRCGRAIVVRGEELDDACELESGTCRCGHLLSACYRSIRAVDTQVRRHGRRRERGRGLDRTVGASAAAFDYSDAYRIRAKIHKASSLATLPLFATEGIIGQSLYSNPTGGKKDAHLAVAAGIGVLFGVNTVTGVWNLIEARKDPNHRKRRLLHGLLMLGADAGFVTTAALGPETEHGTVESSRSAHRAAAFTSIGLATTGYLVMLLGDH